MTDRVKGITVVLLFLSCLALFLERGPYRAVRYSKAYDFSTLYAAGRSWIAGTDPYEVTNLKQQLSESGAPASLVQQQDVNPCLYLVSAMPLVAVIAWLPWHVATVAFCVLCLGILAASLWCVIAQTSLSSRKKWICYSLSLVFCPVYVGMLYENPTCLVCGLVALAIFLPHTSDIVRGILLGLAISVKPQIALYGVCVFAVWKLWTPVLLSTLLSIALTVIGMLRAANLATCINWWHSHQANFALNALPGAKSDPGPNSHWALELLNGQTIAGLFFRAPNIRDLSLWIAAGTLLTAYLIYRGWRRIDRGRDLVFFTAWTTIIAYHRYYDAQVFLVLWPALVKLWSGFHQKLAIAIAACLCLLVLPSEGLIARLLHSDGTIHSAADVLFFRHQPMAILAIALLAVFCWPSVQTPRKTQESRIAPKQ